MTPRFFLLSPEQAEPPQSTAGIWSDSAGPVQELSSERESEKDLKIWSASCWAESGSWCWTGSWRRVWSWIADSLPFTSFTKAFSFFAWKLSVPIFIVLQFCYLFKNHRQCVLCACFGSFLFLYILVIKKGFKGGRWRRGKRDVSYGKNEGNKMEKTLEIFKGLDKRKLIQTAKIGEWRHFSNVTWWRSWERSVFTGFGLGSPRGGPLILAVGCSCG